MSTEDPFTGVEPPAGVDYGNFSFTVQQFVLSTLAEAVSHAVPSRDSQPALGCFQVRVRPGDLRLAATDNERAMFAVTSAVTSSVDTGESLAYIPAKRLLSILREAPSGDVKLTVKKNQATAEVGGTTWVVRLPDASAYPVLPDADTLTLTSYNRTGLLTALRAVRHAICKDAGQPALTQVAVTQSGDSTAVTASDRTRLARSPLPGFPFQMTVPAGVLDDLLRLLNGYPADEVLVGETVSSLVFRAGAVTLTVNKRTTLFPDMDKQLLAPAQSSNKQKLTVDKAELERAVRRVAVNSDAKTSAIALRLSAGSVVVESQDKSGNSATESVMASWEGPERVLVVNHGYLTDMLSAHPSPSCEFLLGPDMGKKLSNLLLVSGGTTQVLTRMPAALLGY